MEQTSGGARRKSLGRPLGTRNKPKGKEPAPGQGQSATSVHLVIMGQELLFKKVAKSGKSGRVYLPLDWVGKRVKVVRLD